MNQPAQRKNLRLTMPQTAKWVEERRAEYGAAFVNDCLKRAVAGEPGLFYAIEGGQVIGAGLTFAAFMAQPAGSVIKALPLAADHTPPQAGQVRRVPLEIPLHTRPQWIAKSR
jgi:hypothetical protein